MEVFQPANVFFNIVSELGKGIVRNLQPKYITSNDEYNATVTESNWLKKRDF